MAQDDENTIYEEEQDFIRPFLVTSGRTTSAVETKLETLVQRVEGADGSMLRFETARIFEMSVNSISIAELSAHLGMPSGVVRVAVGDLIESGQLRAHRTVTNESTNDIELISRLMAGVRRL